jgi:predicted PurR-regulated permease PerM
MAAQGKASAGPFRVTILVLAIIAFMYFAGEVLKPLILSVLLSFALTPMVRFLERWRLPRAAAVVLTGVLTLGVIGGVGYIVGQQLTALANRLPDYHENIEQKLSKVFQPGQQWAADRLKGLADQVTAKMQRRPAAEDSEETQIQKVEVVDQPAFQERLRTATGPYLEFLGVGSFVVILVLFMLKDREDLGDRIIQLFGHHHVSLTTRTTEEIARRITRYLATFSLVNSAFGVVIWLGMCFIGVPYAVLWGCLAGMLRFIPYVGPAVAFVLPLVFSFAQFPGWKQPLEVVVLFALVETALNSFVEPVIYGKTTGVSALGLLVAAMFWTWMWGTLGLLLSTPLTVCLAVVGKYVPGLRFFAIILGEEAELAPDVRFYQRLVALDSDGAVALIEEALKRQPRARVFDDVLVPALSRAERDAELGELGEQELAFVWRVVDDLLEELNGTSEVSLATAVATCSAEAGADAAASPDRPVLILGVAVQDTSDALVLKMLAQLISPAGCLMNIITGFESPLKLAAQVTQNSPCLVIMSHLPPAGLTQARYLVRRLRAQFAKMPLVVGRWGATGGAAAQSLAVVGATHVVFTLEEARDRILAVVHSKVGGSGISGMVRPWGEPPARSEAKSVVS